MLVVSKSNYPDWVLCSSLSKSEYTASLKMRSTLYMNRLATRGLTKLGRSRNNKVDSLPQLLSSGWNRDDWAYISNSTSRVRRYTLSRGSIVRKKSSREQWEVIRSLSRLQGKYLSVISHMVWPSFITLALLNLCVNLRPKSWSIYQQVQPSRISWELSCSALGLTLVNFNVIFSYKFVKIKFWKGVLSYWDWFIRYTKVIV